MAAAGSGGLSSEASPYAMLRALGGGLWSLISGQHSSAVHWVAPEAMACS